MYHGISIAYGGDSAIQDKDAWITDWVSLVKQVLKSDACEVSLHARGQLKVHLLLVKCCWLGYPSYFRIRSRHESLATQADRSITVRAM